MAFREVDAVDEYGALVVLPVNPRLGHLVAHGHAVELAVVTRRPDGVNLGVPIDSPDSLTPNPSHVGEGSGYFCG
jgi:hypothetical protein